jgi:ribokinase
VLDLLTIGDVSMDTFCILDHDEASVMCNLDKANCQLTLNYASKIPLKDIRQTGGGNAANAAVSAARLHLNTSIVASMGVDETSRKILLALEKENINLDNIARSGRTNQSVALVYAGERTLLTHHEDRHYHFGRPEAAQWLYLTSMARGGEKIMNDLLSYADANNTKIVFNPGTYQIKQGAAAYRQVLGDCEIIILNKEEAAKFTNTDKTASTDDLLAKLLELGPRIAVITDGTEGSLASDSDETYTCPIMPARRVESTGAGDAYASAFVAAIIHGEDLPTAMKWGTANAASVIEHIGPQRGLLTLAQIKHKIIGQST